MDNWLQFTNTLSEYRQYSSQSRILQQYFSWLWSTREYVYCREQMLTFGPGSILDFAGLTLLRNVESGIGNHHHVLEGDGVVVYTGATGEYGSDIFQIVVAGKTADAADTIMAQVKSGIVAIEPEEDKALMSFWRTGGSGGTSAIRQIGVRKWADIEPNYSASTRGVLKELMQMTPETIEGKIALFYGPPGTGKTTLLRALADAWRDWVTVEYVIDPEHLFSSAAYLTSVIVGDSDSGGHVTLGNSLSGRESGDHYRLLVLEDAGELIADDARQQSGQALSRLLNMADGMLGEGTNLLIAITTNEDISALHPAITRPGRCLVKAEIGKLPIGEAQDWIGDSYRVTEPMTLAELYHAKKGLGQTALGTDEETEPQIGQYL